MCIRSKDIKVSLEKLTFNCATTDQQKLAIENFNKNYFESACPYLSYSKEDMFNTLSLYFSLSLDGEVVASIRITPSINNQYEFRDVVMVDSSLENENTIQLSRFAIDHSYRNINTISYFFYKLSQWLLSNSKFTHYIAVAEPQFARVYKRYGATQLTFKPVYSQKRLKNYHLLYGDISDTYKKINQMGNVNHQSKNEIKEQVYA